MAVNLCGDTVEVFKFKETGVVALCQEVAEFIKYGYDVMYNLDVSSAEFRQDDETVSVVFKKK